MKIRDLKEAVDGIRVSDDMLEKITENVKKQTEKNVAGGKYRQKTDQEIRAYKWQKTAAAAAIVIVVMGAAVFPVRAFVNSLVRERMERMTEEEINAAAQNVEDQVTEGDSYSRDYTEREKERYHDLYQQYKSGLFPEREIPKVSTEEEAGQHEFCYLTTAAHFYLPERELTDEELLEIIDFILKREYAFSQHYEEEYAEETAQEKEKEKEEITANIEDGGITQEQAIETATTLLSDLYGITGEGMERNHWYDNGEEVLSPDGDGILRSAVEPFYCVNWSDIIAHQYYYFYISGKDGRLTYASHSSSDIARAEGVAIEEAEDKIAALDGQASAFIQEKIKETYLKEYVYYLTSEDGLTTGFVRFVFEKEDGSAYEVSYLWDGTFIEFEEAELSDYENGQTFSLNLSEGETEVTAVFKPLSK